MSLRQKSILGVFWVFLQQFSNQAVGFIISIFLARLLMPEDFGLIGMIAVFIAVSQTLLDAGLTQSIIRQSKPTQSDYSTVFFFNLGASIIIYFLMYLCAGYIADFYKQPLLRDIVRVSSLIFVINAFGAVQFTRLTKSMDFKTQMSVTVPSMVISGIVGVFLAYRGFGVWSLVYMNLIQASLRTVQVWWRSKWVPSLHFSKRRFKYHFNFSYKLALSGLLDTVFKNIYQIIIGKYFSSSQVGYYTRAVTLKNLPIANISTALNKVTYPMFAEIKDDNSRLRSAYEMVMQTVFFVICPVMIYLHVVAEPLFRLLFTEKWLPAVPYFQVMCFTGILYPLHSYNLNVIKVKGRSDLFLRLEVIKKVVNVLIIMATIRYGIIVMLWGQLVSSVFSLVINSYYTGEFISYPLFTQLKDILPIFLISSTSGALTWLLDVNYFYHLNDIFRILLSGLIGLIIFVGASVIFKLRAMNYLKTLIKNR